MKSNKNKTPSGKEAEIEPEELDLTEGMGILPEDVPFTQNIGCVGGKTKKPANTSKKPTE